MKRRLVVCHERGVDAEHAFGLPGHGERCLLSCHRDAVAHREHPAIRNAFVVRTELETIVGEAEAELVEPVRHDGALGRCDRADAVSHAVGVGCANAVVAAQNARAGRCVQRKRDGRRVEHGSASVRDAVGHAIADVDREHGGSVGRLYLVVLGALGDGWSGKADVEGDESGGATHGRPGAGSCRHRVRAAGDCARRRLRCDGRPLDDVVRADAQAQPTPSRKFLSHRGAGRNRTDE